MVKIFIFIADLFDYRIDCVESQSVDEAIKLCNDRGVSILDVYDEDGTFVVKAMKPVNLELKSG